MVTVSGKHRTPQGSSTRRVAAVTIALVVVVGVAIGGWYGSAHFTDANGCRAHTGLNVSAAPEIEPALQQVATDWNASDTRVSGQCVRVTVSSDTPADVAAALAAAHGVSVSGLGQPNGDTDMPDVWVPDSSMWLARLQGASTPVDLNGKSVASSPVVLAVPQPVAASLASGSKIAPKWTDLLAKLRSGSIKTGIVDPNIDASGLAALLAVGGATQAGATTVNQKPTANQKAAAQAATVGAIRALSSGSSQLRADLLGRFPRSADAATIARSLQVAPLPEQAVLAYDAAKPPVPLVGLYPDPSPPALDYPYTTMPGLSSAKSAAAARFAKQLIGAAWTNKLAGVDLRAADGTYGSALPVAPTTPAGPLTSAQSPPTAQVDQALSAWSAVTVPGRMLAVIDVSGSMAAAVPSAGGRNREQVTVAAARSGLGLFDDAWSVGLWTFSTKLDGSKPYKQLSPIAPLATGRGAMTAALGGIKPIPNGQTGLYDTVLAAYKTVQKGWDPGRVNSVVIMTDGENLNPGGLTLSQLLSQIKSIADPKRPIEVIAIGIGNEVDKSELDKITAATGGGAFVTADPAQIGEIFLKAISLRPGAAK